MLFDSRHFKLILLVWRLFMPKSMQKVAWPIFEIWQIDVVRHISIKALVVFMFYTGPPLDAIPPHLAWCLTHDNFISNLTSLKFDTCLSHNHCQAARWCLQISPSGLRSESAPPEHKIRMSLRVNFMMLNVCVWVGRISFSSKSQRSEGKMKTSKSRQKSTIVSTNLLFSPHPHLLWERLPRLTPLEAVPWPVHNILLQFVGPPGLHTG